MAPFYDQAASPSENSDDDTSPLSFGQSLYKTLMNGVSHMIPFVVTATEEGLVIPGDSPWMIISQIGELTFARIVPVLSGFIAPIWRIIVIPIITTAVVGLLFIYLIGAPIASLFDALTVALAGMFSATDKITHGGPIVDVFGFFIAVAAAIAVNALLIIVLVGVSNRGNKKNKEPRTETALIAEYIVLLDAEFQSRDEAITALVDTAANA